MPTFSTILPTIPADILVRLEQTYSEIKHHFRSSRWEPSELNGGKFCEVVIRLLEWHTSSPQTYTPFGTQIRDFGQATRRFETLTTFPDSVRFHIPKLLNALYTLRNKRGVGHTGGDVDPNHMDATLVVATTDWMMAEIVRIFHAISTHEAQAIVESLIVKQLQVVWEVDGKHRVLDASLSYTDKALLLLYKHHPKPVNEGDLISWTEHSNASTFRRDVLKRCHRRKLIEYDAAKKQVFLSPLGVTHVENTIPLALTP
jgi:hypothetical protein